MSYKAPDFDIVLNHPIEKTRRKSTREQLIDFALHSPTAKQLSPMARHLLIVYALKADRQGHFETTQAELCELLGVRDRGTILDAHKEIGNDVVSVARGNDRKPSVYAWDLKKVYGG